MSTQHNAPENISESLENPDSLESVEQANEVLDGTPYTVESSGDVYEVVETETKEHVTTYNDLEELAQDLERANEDLDGLYGFIQNEEIGVVYARWSGDNLVESTETRDLRNMR